MRPKRQYSDDCGSLSEAAAIEVRRAKAALALAEIPDGHRWDAPPKAEFAQTRRGREVGSNPRSPIRMTELFRDCQILDLELRNISVAALHARAVPA